MEHITKSVLEIGRDRGGDGGRHENQRTRCFSLVCSSSRGKVWTCMFSFDAVILYFNC